MPSANDLNAISAEEAARALAYRDNQHAMYFRRLQAERALASNTEAVRSLRKRWAPLIKGPSPAEPLWTLETLDVASSNFSRYLSRHRRLGAPPS